MAYTTTGSVDLVQTAYDRLAYFALRPELYFDQCADVQPTNQSMPGSSVVFTIMADLAVASSTLNESTDVTPVALSDSQVTVSLAEYGNAVNTTAKLRGTAFVDIDPIVADVIGFNAGVSLDEIAKTVLQAGTNVDYSQVGSAGATTRGTLVSANIMASGLMRLERTRLKNNNVPTVGAGGYAAYIHPSVALDLRTETGDLGWRDPHVYGTDQGPIWAGELGMFEGFRYIETPRAPVFATGGSSSIPVYATLCMGRQALAKAHSVTDGNGAFPHIVPGPVIDSLRRLVPWGWYWLGGYAVFRQAALRRVETSSSVAFVDVPIDD